MSGKAGHKYALGIIGYYSVLVQKLLYSSLLNDDLSFAICTIITFTQAFRIFLMLMVLPLPLLPIECCFCFNSDNFIGEWASHWSKNYTLGK